MGLLAVLATACPAADQDAATARNLERRLDELGRRWRDQQDYYHARETALAAQVAMFSRHNYGREEYFDAAARLAELIEKDQKLKAPLVLEMTIAGRRLERYKKTGDISEPSEAEVAQLKATLAHPWPRDLDPDEPRAPKLSTDVIELMRQLRETDRLLGRLPAASVATRRATPPRAPEPPRSIVLTRPAAPRASFARARELPPSLPDLMDWLGSSDPRRRALAADELATREKAAGPALPKLRLALSDPDARVRASAVLAISTIAAPTPDILADVRRALGDKNEDVQLSARSALMRLSQPALKP